MHHPFDWATAFEFAHRWYGLGVALLVGYVPSIALLHCAMRRRHAFDLTTPLLLWNASLSCLSFYGFSVLLPRLWNVDFIHSITSLDYANQHYGYIVFLFNLSKFPEMVDTVFLVLRKRPLTFLHVFHHLSVATYCSSTLLYPTPLGYWYALMNTFVHGVMYGYFALEKQLKRCTYFHPMALTILQIGQMYWGLALNVLYLFQPTTVFDRTTVYHAVYGTLMYGSYLAMFCRFFAEKYRFQTRVNWFMCFYMLTAHVGAAFGLMRASWGQLAEALVWAQICGMGVTAGMHRLWTHRSYKAKLPARLVMALLASATNQGSIYHWCRDHRVHHKFSDTGADPHDINRGFFYAHMGWLLLAKDPRVKDAGRKVHCQDLLDDPVVAWNARLNPWLDQVVCFLVPGVYGAWRCGSFVDGVLLFGALRWVVELHMTWCVNSVAHSFGTRPYKPDIRPCESLVTSLAANGEGWHNWHHAFPFDYATSEFGVLRQWNPTKVVIDVLASVGQAYDLKRHARRASADSIEMTDFNGDSDQSSDPASDSIHSKRVSKPT